MVKDEMTPRDHPDMNFRLKPESKMSHYMALLFAAACGMAVANIYFAQPLLNSLADEFGITYSSIGIVITITQLCYAAGLLLIVPLGDLLNRRRLIIGQMLLSVLALILVGIAPIVTVLFLGLAVVGLLARTFAGVLTDFAGWRSVYLVSAVIMLILTGVLFRVLPRDDSKRESLSYVHLLRSMFILFIQERILRIRGILALLIFIVFGTLWTSLVLPLSTAPYSLSHTAIGAFGLAGAAGALGAARAGSLADRGFGQITTGIALVLLFISWFFISLTEHSLIALVIGIILLDLSVQAVHVTNQSMIFTVRAEARSRLTAAYMIFYSIGSAIGSIVSTSIYATYGWGGVCLFGASISALAILYWFITYRLTKQITVVSQTK